MQADKQYLYKKTAEDFEIDLDLITSVGDACFAKWNEWQRMPDSLILKIDNIGTQYLRYSKVKDVLIPRFTRNTKFNNFPTRTEKQAERYENEVAFIERLNYLLEKVYPRYFEKKKFVRQERNKVQKPRDESTKLNYQQKKISETRPLQF